MPKARCASARSLPRAPPVLSPTVFVLSSPSPLCRKRWCVRACTTRTATSSSSQWARACYTTSSTRCATRRSESMSSGTFASPQINQSGWMKAPSARLWAQPGFPHVYFPAGMLLHTKFHFTPANSKTVTVRRESCYILAKKIFFILLPDFLSY